MFVLHCVLMTDFHSNFPIKLLFSLIFKEAPLSALLWEPQWESMSKFGVYRLQTPPEGEARGMFGLNSLKLPLLSIFGG